MEIPIYNYRATLAEMPSYDVTERDWRIKVNSNECGMNLPPVVAERVMTRLSALAYNRYPNYEPDRLKEAIAKSYGFKSAGVILGNGSSEIIEKIFYAFGGGHKIVYPQPSFSMYKIYAKAADAEGIPVDLDENYQLDSAKFIETVNKNHAALAVVCNPNNPTGNLYPIAQIEEIAAAVKCPLLVDEAYMEFAEFDDPQATAIGLMNKYPNIIVARTFSKAYGLAACRIGYLLAAAPIAAMISKAFMPYHVNVLTLTVADIVWQMRDEFTDRIAQMVSERKRLSYQLAALKMFEVYPSSTNFILIRTGYANDLNEYLADISIGVRSFGNAPRLENTLRLSVGTPSENDDWLLAIKTFIKDLRHSLKTAHLSIKSDKYN